MMPFSFKWVQRTLPAASLVPGDLVQISMGQVPAEVKLIDIGKGE